MAEGFLTEKMVVEKSYRLELTEEEATFLSVLLGAVGGDPDGYRGLSNKIANALQRAFLNDRERNSYSIRHSDLGEKIRSHKSGFIHFDNSRSEVAAEEEV